MGAFLEKPKTEKTTTEGEGHGIKYGVSAMQGWRMEMEDAHVCDTKLPYDGTSFFGVFDGHAGRNVSRYCSTKLLGKILDCIGKSNEEVTLEDIKKGVHEGFLKLDEDMKSQPQWANGEDRGGTTAITVMVTPSHVIWANCGDSRGLLVRGDQVEFATVDHKPYHERERERIEKAGGTVMMQRVNGSLAVSRALGDFDYKRSDGLPPTAQLVSPEPEITAIERSPTEDQFLLLACDGIFDVMSNDVVKDYVLHRLKLTDNLTQICSDLIDACLNKNSRDNMSVVLIAFPSAPKVSQEAIEEDKKLQMEAKGEIKKKLEVYAKGATDQLELEENAVLQELCKDLPEKYDIMGKRQFVVEELKVLRKEKFGNVDIDENDRDFSGSHDPSDAPEGFALNIGGMDYVISEDRGEGIPAAVLSDGNRVSSSPEQTSSQVSSASDKEQNSSKKTKT